MKEIPSKAKAPDKCQNLEQKLQLQNWYVYLLQSTPDNLNQC